MYIRFTLVSLSSHKLPRIKMVRGAKKRKLISQLPLENHLIFKDFILLEISFK